MNIDKLMRLADRYCTAWPYCDTPSTFEQTPAQKARAALSSAIEACVRAALAAERERCAKVCEAQFTRYNWGSENAGLYREQDALLQRAISAIRALKDE